MGEDIGAIVFMPKLLLAWGQLKGETTNPRRVTLLPGTCNQEIPDLEPPAVAKCLAKASANCFRAGEALEGSQRLLICRLRRNPFDYLSDELQRHTQEVASPAERMPWNYRSI
jgi:hypothetical protein